MDNRITPTPKPVTRLPSFTDYFPPFTDFPYQFLFWRGSFASSIENKMLNL